MAKLDDYVREQGGELWLARAHPRVGDMLDRGKEIGAIKDIPRYLTIDDAESAYRERQVAVSTVKGREVE
jgi:hypothetical protein